MSDKDKTLLIVILAIISLCGCFAASCCAASLYLVSRTDRNTIQEFLSDNLYDMSENNPDSGSIVVTEENIEDDFNSEVLSKAEQSIIAETEKTRGLSGQRTMVPIYQSEDELREHLSKQMDEISNEELEDELALYNLLGFAPENFDLRQFYVDLYTEQIAGYYDPKDNRMYLIQNSSPYDNAIVLSHEYTHYLQYNNPDFAKTLIHDDDFCEENGETCLVIDAIIEGDATLTENLIDTDTILKKYRSDSYSESASANSVLDSSPKFFQDSLLFSYIYGFDFVSYHYLKGGFDAVNDLYINLPQSVEQIMHPEKYLKDAPVEVTLDPFKSIITENFDIIREDVFNESDVKMIFSDGYNEDWQLSDRQASTAAEGWGGGSYIFAKNDGKHIFFSKSVWDTEKDAEEAESMFVQYCDKRFGNQKSENSWLTDKNSKVYLIRQNDILYWMILPDNFDSEKFVDLIRHGSIL